MIKFFKTHKRILWFSYMLFYFPVFSHLEKTVTSGYHLIHMPIDDKIPFCEFFIIPYMLWFTFVIIGLAYFFFKDAWEFSRLCIFLGVGMTVFLIVSAVYPNGQDLRPLVFPRDNIFTHIVGWLYSTDTPTNLFPSIHVYNSLGINLAVWNSVHLKKRPVIRWMCMILTVLIILSTMFLKQHSVFDVLTAFLLCAVMWMIIYFPLSPFSGRKKARQP